MMINLSYQTISMLYLKRREYKSARPPQSRMGPLILKITYYDSEGFLFAVMKKGVIFAVPEKTIPKLLD